MYSKKYKYIYIKKKKKKETKLRYSGFFAVVDGLPQHPVVAYATDRCCYKKLRGLVVRFQHQT